MNAYIFAVIAIVCACIFPISGDAQSLELRVKDILLTSRHVDGSSYFEEIHGLQKREGISDAQISTVLQKLLNGALAREDDPLARELAGNAVHVLSRYGNDHVKELLCNIIENKKGSLRHRAIESYMHLVDYSITGVIVSLLTETAKYDDLDRRTVYKAYIKRARNIKKESREREQAVAVICRFFEREEDNGNRILLDKSLIDMCPDHKLMRQRQEWLSHLKNSPIDSYRLYSHLMSVTNDVP